MRGHGDLKTEELGSGRFLFRRCFVYNEFAFATDWHDFSIKSQILVTVVQVFHVKMPLCLLFLVYLLECNLFQSDDKLQFRL